MNESADLPKLPSELPENVSTKSGSLGELATKMGIEVVQATPQRVVATMPVEGNRQPFGLLHGGANLVLAETVGSIAASLHALPTHRAVGLEISATHHRSPTSGLVTAIASAVSTGRTVAVYEVVITDESGKRTCTSRITCLLRPIPS